MAQIDPRMLMQAAMAQQGGADQGAPANALSGIMPQASPMEPGPAGATTPVDAPGAQAPTAGAPTPTPMGGSMGGAPDPNSGGMSNVDLAGVLGQGTDMSQDPEGIQAMVAMMQDPSTPPDQRAQLQMRLQLAALSSLTGGPSGVPGGSS